MATMLPRLVRRFGPFPQPLGGTRSIRVPGHIRETGEDVVIARAGRPVARLVAYARATSPRRPGAWRRRVEIADDFDVLPAELEAVFAGDAE